jgi:hypothetical protein
MKKGIASSRVGIHNALNVTNWCIAEEVSGSFALNAKA